MKLHALLAEKQIVTDLAARTKEDAIREMVGRLAVRRRVRFSENLLAALLERETLGSTAIGEGVAVPHAKLPRIRRPLVMLGLSRDGVAFDAADERPSHAIFLAASPVARPEVNLRILATIARLVRASRGLAARLSEAPTARDALRILREEEDALVG